MESSVSSGYSSHDSSSNGYDNKVGDARDGNSTRKESISNGSVFESEIKEESIYHRILDDDGMKDQFVRNNKQGEAKQPRPLPPLPGQKRESKGTEKVPRKRAWLRILLPTVVLVLAVCVAIGVYIRLSCYRDWFCSKNKGIRNDKGHPCDAQTSSNYSNSWNSTCTLNLYNATALLLQSEGKEPETYTLENGNFNTTINGLIITLSRQPESLSIDIEIQEVNCSTIGTFFVTLINGTHNETYRVNVKVNPTTQQCPCDLEFDAGKAGYIKCVTSTGVNASVTFRNATSEIVLAEIIEINDIITNGSIPTAGLSGLILRATSTGSGALLYLEFSIVKCYHWGTFVIQLGNTSYETNFTVKSYPRKPTIGIDHDQLGGLVQDKYGEVRCEAFVGCGQPPTLYQKVLDRFDPVTKNTLSTNKTYDNGITFYEAETFDPVLINHNGTTYKCSFLSNGKLYESEVYTALVVPEDYCSLANITEGCNGRHPYDCRKYITCFTRPWERPCGVNQHFYFKKNETCHGECDIPRIAKCQN